MPSFLLKTLGYLELEISDFKAFQGNEFIDVSNIRVRKINKTARGIVGTFSVVSKELDNDFIVVVRLYQKQGGEYRKTPYHLQPIGACDSINGDIYAFPEFAKVSNLVLPVSCPISQVNVKHSRDRILY
jgi:hypothetical protein